MQGHSFEEAIDQAKNEQKATVYVWVPKQFCRNPFSKAAYGHAAMLLPPKLPSNNEEEKGERKPLYVSFFSIRTDSNSGNPDVIGSRDYDDNHYNDDGKYKLFQYSISLDNNKVDAMHNTLDEMGLNDLDEKTMNYEAFVKPGDSRFTGYTDLLCCSQGNNCTSVIVKLLKAASVELPHKWEMTLRNLFMAFCNGGVTGFTLGSAVYICKRCLTDQKSRAEDVKLSFILGTGIVSFINLILYAFRFLNCGGERCCRSNVWQKRGIAACSWLVAVIAAAVLVFYLSVAHQEFTGGALGGVWIGLGSGVGLAGMYFLYSCLTDRVDGIILPEGLAISLKASQVRIQDNSIHYSNLSDELEAQSTDARQEDDEDEEGDRQVTSNYHDATTTNNLEIEVADTKENDQEFIGNAYYKPSIETVLNSSNL